MISVRFSISIQLGTTTHSNRAKLGARRFKSKWRLYDTNRATGKTQNRRLNGFFLFPSGDPRLRRVSHKRKILFGKSTRQNEAAYLEVEATWKML